MTLWALWVGSCLGLGIFSVLLLGGCVTCIADRVVSFETYINIIFINSV